MASSHAYKVTKCRANYLQIYFNHIILSESLNLLLFWDLYLTYNLHNADIGIYSNRDLVLLPALLPFMIWCVLSFTLHMETFSWHSRSLPHKQTPEIAKSTATTKSKKNSRLERKRKLRELLGEHESQQKSGVGLSHLYPAQAWADKPDSQFPRGFMTNMPSPFSLWVKVVSQAIFPR